MEVFSLVVVVVDEVLEVVVVEVVEEVFVEDVVVVVTDVFDEELEAAELLVLVEELGLADDDIVEETLLDFEALVELLCSVVVVEEEMFSVVEVLSTRTGAVELSALLC